jgi:hypothetical protein
LGGRFTAGIAGIVGAVVAFGVAELVHGLLNESVPSVFAALAQGVIEYTPGELVTRGIELLGQADIPVLITSMVIGALVVAAALANRSDIRLFQSLSFRAKRGIFPKQRRIRRDHRDRRRAGRALHRFVDQMDQVCPDVY